MSFLDTIDLEYAKKDIDWFKPYYVWFVFSINKECRKIVECGGMPTKLYLKYNFEPSIAYFHTNYGSLNVIIDKNMEELIKIK